MTANNEAEVVALNLHICLGKIKHQIKEQHVKTEKRKKRPPK